MISIPTDKLIAFCKKNHIRKLSLFGSALKDRETPESDIDLIVEFEPDYIPGFQFFEIEAELGDLFGKPVDLNTPAFLSRYFRDQVMKEAKVCYSE